MTENLTIESLARELQATSQEAWRKVTGRDTTDTGWKDQTEINKECFLEMARLVFERIMR